MSHDDDLRHLRELGQRQSASDLDPSRIAEMNEAELRAHIFELKETDSTGNQRMAYEAFVIWERNHSARSAATIFHVAHSLLLSGSSVERASSLAERMRDCDDYKSEMDCDWLADVALAHVRQKNQAEAVRSLRESDNLLDIDDINRWLRNEGVRARIFLANGHPYAKVLFWKITENFKACDREGIAIEPVYFRNVLWFAMVAAARWQRKELQGQDEANVFSQLYDEVMSGVQLHAGTLVVESRFKRRLAAQALKWSTPIGRPFIAWLICHQ